MIASDGRAALTRLRVRGLQAISDPAAIRSHEDIDRVAVQVENTSVDIDEVAEGLRERADKNAGAKRAAVSRHAASASRATAAASTPFTANSGSPACTTVVCYETTFSSMRLWAMAAAASVAGMNVI